MAISKHTPALFNEGLPDPRLQQFRMRRLQVHNWGTFNGLTEVPIAERGFLFYTTHASDPLPVKTEYVGDADATSEVGNRSLVLFDSGDEITVQAGPDGVRFLLVSGMPLAEPVAWRGPIVMNTAEELQQAFSELRQGTFITR